MHQTLQYTVYVHGMRTFFCHDGPKIIQTMPNIFVAKSDGGLFAANPKIFPLGKAIKISELYIHIVNIVSYCYICVYTVYNTYI